MEESDGKTARSERFGRPKGVRPRTGDLRKAHQPFAIDKLPFAWRERIIELRAQCMTWERIEQESATWEWDELTAEQQKVFRERRIPMSTLHRWYDVQVRQKLKEIDAGSVASVIALAAAP